MSDPENYTIGWICAIQTEYVAARAFLDEEHNDPLVVSPSDNNAYTRGKIGEHNVVMAVLPDGEYGISSAASVARDMMHTFYNIRISLMVGIGGGAPSKKHDIRLGDIVVSATRDGKGGVIQYDFGKAIQDQSFKLTGFLNQPPAVLRTAMAQISGQHESDGHSLDENINDALRKKPRLQKTYSRPDSSRDRLYHSGIVHPVKDEASCVDACGDDPSKLILRNERSKYEDNPAIHYGLIASANQLMKDAMIRDKLAAEKGVLCFEMEAAGLMNHFPCLVIRGICDYADTHKNNEWQGYAAMTAAAYAKELLRRIAPNKIEAEKKLGDILSGLHEVAEKGLDIQKQQLQAQKDFANERLSKEEQRCHQLFRLTTGSNGATYEWYKDRVEDRVRDTCLWFLKHDHLQSWLDQESGPLLLTADPGCGKSVLAKYMIDHGLPQSATICYFFFKDQDQNTARQALCALLHQLFTQKPPLIKHALPQFHKDGDSLIDATESLWEVLRNAVTDPQAGTVIIVLDALDECAESELEGLMRNVKRQFPDDQSGHGRLKYLLTSRPYEQIVYQFRDPNLLKSFPKIRIPGEEESESIGLEVSRVISHRVNVLSEKMALSPPIKCHLEERLQKITHRTYLWVYLVFDYLEKGNFKKTLKGIESTILTLPKNINEAYEQILNKSNDEERRMVRKTLSIILAARRPLTLPEMNVALSIEDTSQSIQDLDLENENDFKARLRSWCGLFVSIHHGKIYFLHQTAREFLLASSALPMTTSSELRWQHSITTCQAHAVLAELCVLYLNFFNSDVSLPTDANGEGHQFIDSHAFLDYSAKTWGGHFREAGIMDDATIVPYALKISNSDSKSYSAWFEIYWETTRRQATNFTDLMLASYFGHSALVKVLLEKGSDMESRDSYSGPTALMWAAGNGHAAVVKLLLENDADVEAKNEDPGTSLLRAAWNGHEAVVKLLLDKGADVKADVNEYGETPLLWAAGDGHEVVVKLLLDKGADVEAKDRNFGRTPLSWAAEDGHEAVVKLLLDKDADVTGKDDVYGRTPLMWAAKKGREAVVKLLVEKGADIEAKDSNGRTALWLAAVNGHEAVVKLLVEKGADIEAKDNGGQTALSWAAENGREAIVKLVRKYSR